MTSRTEDITREDRHSSIINYLLVTVIKYTTKTALRTRFLLVHSLRAYSQFIMGGGGKLARAQTH